MGVDKIVEFAESIAKEDALKMRQYIEWQEYIEPLVQSRFKLKGRFDINLRNMAKQEIQDYINKVEAEFLDLYKISLNPLEESLCRDDVTLHGDDLEEDLHTIYVDKNDVYHAVSENTGKIRYFTYTKPLDLIKRDHSDEILTYMFGKNYDKDERVHGIDVFTEVIDL